VNDFSPKFRSADLVAVQHFIAGNGIALKIGFPVLHSLHEIVMQLDRHIGAGYLALFQFGVDKFFGVGMLDGYREHQCTPPSVLRHLACRVGITLHERNDPRGRQG